MPSEESYNDIHNIVQQWKNNENVPVNVPNECKYSFSFICNDTERVILIFSIFEFRVLLMNCFDFMYFFRMLSRYKIL